MSRKFKAIILIALFVFGASYVMAGPPSYTTGGLFQAGSASSPSVAIGGTDDGFYSPSNDNITLVLGGLNRVGFSTTYLRMADSSSRAAVLNEIPSSTNPVFAPGGTDDPDTGMSTAGANTVSLVAGGAEAARVDADTTSGNTRFLLYDVDNGTLERVSVGAADSGGVGYKVLRIPN